MMNIDPGDLNAYLYVLSPSELRVCVWHPVDHCLDGSEEVIDRLKGLAREDVVFDYNRATKLASVQERVSTLLAIGFETTSGLHVALDDASRADMGAMATTALAASSGAIEWPESYKQGWITVENVRIALPAPEDGLALAALVGDYYAGVRQRGRTLKDTVAAATKQSDLDAIDIESEWP